MGIDIEAWADRNLGDYRIVGDDIQVNCPFCLERIGKDDTKYHLGINLCKPMVHCFRCEYSSDWIGLVRAITGLSYASALGELYVKPRIADFSSIKNGNNSITFKPQVELPAGFALLNRKVPSHKRAIRYMEQRGFKFEICIKYGLGVTDEIAGRIIIPIEKDYWQGRRLYDWMEPKYLNPKSESKAFLWNSQALNNYDEVVVCEGVFSGMAIGDNSIALISKEPTAERMERIIASKASRFIIALEPGAYGSMHPLMDVLARNNKQVIIWKFSSGDPADPDGRFEVCEYTLRNRIQFRMEAWNGKGSKSRGKATRDNSVCRS